MPRTPSEEEWAIFEENIDEERIRFFETIFTLGNGYLGSRGVLEEGYSKGYAGTYLAGVYDRGDGQSYEIVNVPNPVSVEILVNGRKLHPEGMEVVEHQRVLDMQRAVLKRHTIFADAGRRYEYESLRFFSLKDIHLGVMAFSFRSLDADTEVTIKHTIDGKTRNEVQSIGEPIKHYTVTHTSSPGNGTSYLEAKTPDLGILIGIATACNISGVKPESGVTAKSCADEESVAEELFFHAKKGRRYQFNRYISIYTSRELKQGPEADCINGIQTAMRCGVSNLLKRHSGAWGRRWECSDIRIEGDPEAQRALRFDIYHLLIAAPPQDIDVSIAAKTLSGEWYKGHIFWDTEVHTLPFFIYTQPGIAKDLLRYRYRRLQQAKDGALAQGYQGALWPWESAASGRDETPQSWVNFDGTEIPVYNSRREHHIAGDVTYGVISYYQATGDEDFLLQYGAEMIFEVARFWASRVTYNKRSKHYDIKEVIGPNEFQESVDNNSYTNYLAKWVLRSGAELYDYLRKRHPGRLRTIAERTALRKQETEFWKELAEKIAFLADGSGLVEEFAGYFDRKDVTISEWDENGMPVWPHAITLAKAKETQLVKQADVLLLLHLFSNDFSLEAKKTNFTYYVGRTTHKSSLSMASYAAIALEIGNIQKAQMYFNLAVNTDLGNIYRNTELGIHAAALGGVWQIVVHGFGGVRLKDGVLSISPRLPDTWRQMRFQVWFRGALIELTQSKGEVEVFMSRGQRAVDLEIYGNRYSLQKGQRVYAKEG